MLKILKKRPWHIGSNTSYHFSDINVWESMQDDFTFYIDFRLSEENDEETNCIFCRPGMHMGVFIKEQKSITWDWWDVTNSNGNFNDISFYVGKKNIHKKYRMMITHSGSEKLFKVKLVCLDEFEDADGLKSTNKQFYFEREYDGTLLDYTDTPFNFGIANYEENLSSEHKALCEYELYGAGLFSTIYDFPVMESFIDKNKDCKRTLEVELDSTVFIVNTNELTQYKAYDNSGNCFNLEVNVGLIKKIYGIQPYRTLDVKILQNGQELI